MDRESTDRESTKTHFNCPVLQQALRYECGNKPCKYWVDYKPSDNCLLAYRKEHETDAFSTNEIAYLTGFFQSAVSRLHRRALAKIRQRSLTTQLELVGIEQTFSLVPNSRVCVNCECIFSKSQEVYHTDCYGFKWCTKSCYKEYKPYTVAIEYVFGIPFLEAISWLYRSFWKSTADSGKNIKLLSEAAGIEYSIMEAAFEKFLKTKTKSQDISDLSLQNNKDVTRPPLRMSTKLHTYLTKTLQYQAQTQHKSQAIVEKLFV